MSLGTAAFVAYIMRETSPALAATQFALFSALTALPRTLASATTGFLVEGAANAPPGGVIEQVAQAFTAMGLPADGLGWTRFFLSVCGLRGSGHAAAVLGRPLSRRATPRHVITAMVANDIEATRRAPMR